MVRSVGRITKVPGFAYPGGKVRSRKWLLRFFPAEGRTYVEPFAGRANVFWLAALRLRFERWWLNDTMTEPWLRAIGWDGDIGTVPLRFVPDKLSAYAIIKRIEAKEADALLLSSAVMFSGGMSHMSTQYTSGHTRFSGRSFIETLRNARRILRRTKPRVTALDWRKVVTSRLDERDFCYLDPPYLKEGGMYASGNIKHEALLRMLGKVRCGWVLSGYDSELYRDVLGDPAGSRMKQVSMMGSGSRKRGLAGIELVWVSEGLKKRKRGPTT